MTQAFSSMIPAPTFDEQVLTQFRDLQPWGIDAAIDLYQCDLTLLQDEAYLRIFLGDLCHAINMNPYGEPLLARFGQQPAVYGYTGIQLIETSAITLHCIENTPEQQKGDMCLNIFSCAAFPPFAAAEFCRRAFQAEQVRVAVLLRGRLQTVPGEN